MEFLVLIKIGKGAKPHSGDWHREDRNGKRSFLFRQRALSFILQGWQRDSSVHIEKKVTFVDATLARRPIDCRHIGVDEVGRGALAGSLVVVAARFREMPSGDLLAGLDDSKKLSARRRAELIDPLRELCEFALVDVSAEQIDRRGILVCLRAAVLEAVTGIKTCANAPVIMDGSDLPPGLEGRGVAIPKADATEPVVAAASVIAKEHRDAVMRELAGSYPGYGWEKNVGYGSKQHRQAIADLGPTPLHRKSFITRIVAGTRSLVPAAECERRHSSPSCLAS